MTDSLITLILAVLTTIGFFLGIGDRIRKRRERAEAKDAAEIKKAVDAAVQAQRDKDASTIATAKSSGAALVQQLIERTEDLKRAEADATFWREKAMELLAERGVTPPVPPSAHA